MKKFKTLAIYLSLVLTIIIACTKEVGLYTEVEFEISETHVADGFINSQLATSITVTPEELVEGYAYSYSYKINTGEGYFQDEAGNTIAEGDKIGLSPLSVSLNYIATKIGDHSITFTAEDTFGFQEQVTLSYFISDVPVSWTAIGPTGQVLLGSSQDITITLGSETTTTGVTYERNYSFTQGTGTITSSPSGTSEILNEFVSITPGTNTLTYVATELGQTTIAFLLKDSNGQELLQTVSFEVVDELSTEKEITSFIVIGVEGTIVGTDITIELPEGTDLTTLSPVIIHTGASISPESEVSQDFTNPVIYTVTAQDQTIQTYTVNVTVPSANQAPTAIATSDVTSGAPSLAVQFTGDTSSDPDTGDVLTYAWDFGDGTTATTANPSHTFTTAGTYDVTLTVTDDGTPALSSSEVRITITVTAPANQAPTAVASSDVLTGEASLAVQFTGDTSSDPDTGDTLTYAWDFGDGTTATTANPSHTFTTAGTYDVTLTVTDDGTPALSSSEVTITITVTAPANQAPTAVASSDVTSGEASLAVQFTGDTSSDPDAGDILTYTWDFGDGTTATTANPSHTFTTAGTYDVKLTVTDNGTPSLSSSEVTLTITVTAPANQAPTAVASSDATSGEASLAVQFTGDTSSDPDISDILTYAWDFGDGSTATTANPSHTFTTAGTYDVTLTVTDDGTPALSSSEVTITITVTAPANQAPTAVATSVQRTGISQYIFDFAGDSSSDPDSNPITYLWDFGDGGSSTEINPNHTYTTTGVYNVSLTVSDGSLTNTSSFTVNARDFVIFSNGSNVSNTGGSGANTTAGIVTITGIQRRFVLSASLTTGPGASSNASFTIDSTSYTATTSTPGVNGTTSTNFYSAGSYNYLLSVTVGGSGSGVVSASLILD
ncbi:PKD domain-containing protein [Cellulophaga baltica 4]|nr:PKD domain-containing protein [Cellulophaga baltica 4]